MTTFAEACCVVASIAALTGDNPNAIIAGIAQAAEGDELSFYANGTANRRTYCRYLESRGWRATWANWLSEQPPTNIPATCLVILDGHVFAIVRGALWDTDSGVRLGRPVVAIYEPPSVQATR